MSSRVKALLMDHSGGVHDYRLKNILELGKHYKPDVRYSGNRKKDLELAKEILLPFGYYVFMWREDKQARGRAMLVKKIQKELNNVRKRLTAKMVCEALEKELRSGRIKVEAEELRGVNAIEDLEWAFMAREREID